jgi:transposase-like protein
MAGCPEGHREKEEGTEMRQKCSSRARWESCLREVVGRGRGGVLLVVCDLTEPSPLGLVVV